MFLFSGSVWRLNSEGLGEVPGGFGQRQLVDNGPEVQHVALGLTLGTETAEDVLLQVDGERAAAGVRVAMPGKRTRCHDD